MGNSEQQSRLFGFLRTGRDTVDTVVAFSALAVSTWFGSGLLGSKTGIWFYPLIVIAIGIIIFFVLNGREEAPSVEVKKEDGASKNTSVTSVLKDKTIQPVTLNVFLVYAACYGLTFFIPLLENIYLLLVALVGIYGIISQHCLKMTGGSIGGITSDKILRSPSRYLCYTFIISTAVLILLIMLPHESMPVYLRMACTLGFGAIIFTQRAVFFAPIGEAKIAENKTGTAAALDSFTSYTLAMFCFSLHGYILDLDPGIIGYKIMSSIIACFTFNSAVASAMLARCTNQCKKEMLVVEA